MNRNLSMLETERLLLRPYCREDFDAFAELNADGDVRRHVGKTLSRDEAARRFETFFAPASCRVVLAWAVIQKTDQAYIGHAFLDTGEDSASVQFGVMLASHFWGHGFGTEIARRVIDYALHAGACEAVIATVDPDHRASIRVLEKAGLRFCREEEDVQGTYLLFEARQT